MPRPNHPQATPRRTLNLKHHPFRSCENAFVTNRVGDFGLLLGILGFLDNG
jgi:hypothetical protein